jgi:cell filamentation protein
VTFDPFGDFETQGYLRNVAGEKDPEIIRRLEHSSFSTGIDDALAQLARVGHIAYEDVLGTHETLFDAVYPWAGHDRLETTPEIAVSKGNILFAHPQDIRGAVQYALQKGRDMKFMKSKPGEIMGYLAYGHPFLDGNGRTIMVVHSVLAQRAGFSIKWAATNKSNYLAALTSELENPGKGHLDAYLQGFMQDAVGQSLLADNVGRAPGIGGQHSESDDASANRVLGKFSEPAVQARYRQQQLQRRRTVDDA